MTIGGVGGQAAPTQFNVAVSEKQEDQQEKVVGKLIESVEASSPARTGFSTGNTLNIKA